MSSNNSGSVKSANQSNDSWSVRFTNQSNDDKTNTSVSSNSNPLLMNCVIAITSFLVIYML